MSLGMPPCAPRANRFRGKIAKLNEWTAYAAGPVAAIN
jgi:hypothetical protein